MGQCLVGGACATGGAARGSVFSSDDPPRAGAPTRKRSSTVAVSAEKNRSATQLHTGATRSCPPLDGRWLPGASSWVTTRTTDAWRGIRL